MDLRKDLARLGDSAEEIAANLGAMGIFGSPCIERECPLAHFLNSLGWNLVVVGNTRASGLAEGFRLEQILLTQAQQEFVDRFDTFEIPELIDVSLDIPGLKQGCNSEDRHCQRPQGLPHQEENQKNSSGYGCGYGGFGL